SADSAKTDVDKLVAEQAAARAATAIARSSVKAARYALQRDSVRAPVDADVVQVQIQPGVSVSPQSGPLFLLLPLRPHIVRAELSTIYAGAVHAGMDAQVSPDDDPMATAIAARVLRVGRLVGPSTLEDDPALRSTTRTVQCVLKLDQPGDLRVGQRVLVHFIGEAATRH
ncbi:MAG: HlyD family efflux transporter periplasmic adaptor subunit, partial [Rhodanobacteraceae bacterium]